MNKSRAQKKGCLIFETHEFAGAAGRSSGRKGRADNKAVGRRERYYQQTSKEQLNALLMRRDLS